MADKEDTGSMDSNYASISKPKILKEKVDISRQTEMSGDGAENTQVDIGAEAKKSFDLYSDGELEQIDKHNKIKSKWMKERVIVVLSTVTIVALLLACILILGFSNDETTRDWARQILASLMGFAVGTIWPSNSNET